MVCYMQNYGLHKTKDKVREKCERKENFEGNRLNCWETPFEKVPDELAGVEGIQDSPLINEGFPQCPEGLWSQSFFGTVGYLFYCIIKCCVPETTTKAELTGMEIHYFFSNKTPIK